MKCYHVIHVWPALADGRGCFQSSGPRGKAEAPRRPTGFGGFVYVYLMGEVAVIE